MAKKPTITVMPETPRRFGKKKVLLTAGCAVVLVALGFGAWTWWNNRPDDTSEKKPKKLSTQQVNDVTGKAIASRKYDEALNQLKDQPESVDTQLAIAVIYMNKKDYKSALAIYDELDQKGQLSLGNISGAASFAEVAKEWQKALHYYQEAKKETLAQKNAIPTWKDDVTRYDAAVKRMQGKL
jgi:tetratricopeptide (TPR) repeat protein